MEEMVALRPDLAMTATFGGTLEGRVIRGIRVVNEVSIERVQLPIIVVTGGINARDWIGIMGAINLIHELVEHYDDYRPLVDDIEWFIVPVVNPDGFEFSRLNPAVSRTLSSSVVRLKIFSSTEPRLDQKSQSHSRLLLLRRQHRSQFRFQLRP